MLCYETREARSQQHFLLPSLLCLVSFIYVNKVSCSSDPFFAVGYSTRVVVVVGDSSALTMRVAAHYAAS